MNPDGYYGQQNNKNSLECRVHLPAQRTLLWSTLMPNSASHFKIYNPAINEQLFNPAINLVGCKFGDFSFEIRYCNV
jgi:hypothetical protein